MQKIKSLLVGLEGILDNENLDIYCQLIYSAYNQPTETFKTEKHHVIPVNYFKLLHNCTTRREALQYANALPNFIVNLTPKQHALAHYYLCLCSEGQLHIGLTYAFCLMFKFNTKELLEDRKQIQNKFKEVNLDLYEQLRHEYLADVSRVHKGKVVSKESREKMSCAAIGRVSGMKGRHQTAEAKRKLSESSKGNTNALGYHHNEERRRKMSENCTRSRAVRCVETGHIFRSAHEVLKQFKISNVGNCCKNANLTAGGYHWEYAEADY